MSHWRYFKYVLRHKWFVLVAGLRYRAPVWRLIIHDWSKFLPSEWFAYVRNFYGHKPTDEEERVARNLGISIATKADIKEAFSRAWLLHQRRNKHHWQFWYLINDTDGEYPLPIPYKYVLEMVSDWAGAGRAITGKWEVAAWYQKNADKMKLHPSTRAIVEVILTPPHA